MQLIRYNPIRDLETMSRDLDKLWGYDWGLLPSLIDSTSIDLYEEDGKLIVEVGLTNFKKDEIKVVTAGGILEVSAEHKEKEEKKKERLYYFRERNSRYLRRVTLPENANPDKVEAEFHDGILTLSMPVTASSQIVAKTVPIK